MSPLPNAPFSPKTLGERWGCSSQHIRNMIRTGEIPAFSIGKLFRIPADWVFAHEQAKLPHSDDAEEKAIESVVNSQTSAQQPKRRPRVLYGGIVVD